MPNIRNPKYTAHGSIDVELEHVALGWIPFTASPDDTDIEGQAIFEGLERGDFGTVEPYVAPVLTVEAQRARIAARRYQAEVTGIQVGETMVDTGRDSQALITGAALQSLIDPSYSLRWKTATGVFIELDAQQVIGMATLVRAHVQACFEREAALLAELDAGTLTDNMLEEGWPTDS
ncbi:hypothetical protein D3C81_572220 [compost metagenome]